MYRFTTKNLMLAKKSLHFKAEMLCSLEPDFLHLNLPLPGQWEQREKTGLREHA